MDKSTNANLMTWVVCVCVYVRERECVCVRHGIVKCVHCSVELLRVCVAAMTGLVPTRTHVSRVKSFMERSATGIALQNYKCFSLLYYVLLIILLLNHT